MKEIEGENGKEHLMGTLVNYCMIILNGHECWLSFLIVVVNRLSTRVGLLRPGWCECAYP